MAFGSVLSLARRWLSFLLFAHSALLGMRRRSRGPPPLLHTLLCETLLEPLTKRRRENSAGVRVNEGIRRLLQPLEEVRHLRVRCNEDIAGRALEKRKTPLEVLGMRILFSASEPESVSRHR